MSEKTFVGHIRLQSNEQRASKRDHVSSPRGKIDELPREATDDRRKERIGFLKNLYYGDSVAEAADREALGGRLERRWA